MTQGEGTVLTRFPLRWFLHANLAIGIIVLVSNGSAVALVLLGKGGALADRIADMAIWCAAGALLSIGAVYGYIRSSELISALRFQSLIIFALLVALAAWGLSLLLGTDPQQSRVVWVPGYFSALTLYGVFFIARVFGDTKYLLHRRVLTWVVLPAGVLLDVAMALRIPL